MKQGKQVLEMKRKEERKKEDILPTMTLLAVDHCKRPRTIGTIRFKTASEGDKTHQITPSALKYQTNKMMEFLGGVD